MQSAILAIIISMLVYMFYFTKIMFSRLTEKIDNSLVGIARLNKELMDNTIKVTTDSINEALAMSVDEFAHEYEEDEGEEEGEEEGEYEENMDTIDEASGEEGQVQREADPVADVSEQTEQIADDVVVEEVTKRGRKPKNVKA